MDYYDANYLNWQHNVTIFYFIKRQSESGASKNSMKSSKVAWRTKKITICSKKIK